MHALVYMYECAHAGGVCIYMCMGPFTVATSSSLTYLGEQVGEIQLHSAAVVAQLASPR